MGQLEIKVCLSAAILLMFLISGIKSYPNSVEVSNPSLDGSNKEEGKKFEDAEYWRSSATSALTQKLKERRTIYKAKNGIMFLGDGWDIQTMTAARILKGQKVDKLPFGEEAELYLESFPYTGFSKTYCVDSQVADSACTATAYLGGVKSNLGTIGVTPNVMRHNCTGQSIKANQVISILAQAQAAGKSTGIITTTKITDASPAGTYAHVANRDWECDADVRRLGQDPNTCEDIARQLILNSPGENIDVIMGGGREKFLPEGMKDSEGFSGQRQDGQDLLSVWKKKKEAKGLNAVYVENAKDLEKVDTAKTDALLGLFAAEDIAYYDEREAKGDPWLRDMVKKGIEILSKNPNGFFLFVEGGRIDHGHHANQAQRALWETVDFDLAIQRGDNMTKDEDTIIVVTADHGHTMTFAGYPKRGNQIMGIVDFGEDKLPFSTLNYANGPGFKPFVDNKRYDIRQDDLENPNTRQVPLVPLTDETHGGQDVAILAKGPFSHLVTGVHQQNYIPFVMGYAMCIGEGPKFCDEKPYASAEAGVGQWVAASS